MWISLIFYQVFHVLDFVKNSTITLIFNIGLERKYTQRLIHPVTSQIKLATVLIIRYHLNYQGLDSWFENGRRLEK